MYIYIPHNDGHNEKAGEIPDLRKRAGLHKIVADGDEGAIIEQRNEHQHQHWQLEESRPRLALLSKICCFADGQHNVAPRHDHIGLVVVNTEELIVFFDVTR